MGGAIGPTDETRGPPSAGLAVGLLGSLRIDGAEAPAMPAKARAALA